MGLIKLLIWIVVAWLLVSGLRKLVRGEAGTQARAAHGSETMVRCVSCGLNVPKSEAIAVDGAWACSTEHARVVPHAGDERSPGR